MERKCYNCTHYGCLINQGYWWCELNCDMDKPESCDFFNEVDEGVMTVSSIDGIYFINADDDK